MSIVGEKGKKYGLVMMKGKKAAKPKPKPALSVFAQEDEEPEDVREEIQRMAQKQKTLKKVEEDRQKALMEDPTAFDYDGVYDAMQRQKEETVEEWITPGVDNTSKKGKERKSLYIEGLLEKKKDRDREQDIIYEKGLLKERLKDDHEHDGKEKFVTTAYLEKLKEDKKWIQEEAKRQEEEKRQDVRKKEGTGDFLLNMFGGLRNKPLPKPKPAPTDKPNSEDPKPQARGEPEPPSPPKQEPPSRSRVDQPSNASPSVKPDTGESSSPSSPPPSNVEPKIEHVASKAQQPTQEQKEAQKITTAKRNNDETILSARERYLQRKKEMMKKRQETSQSS